MSFITKAVLSIAGAIAAIVAIASLASALAVGPGGLVVVITILVFTRAVMTFAAEPVEKPQRSDAPR